MIPGYNHNVKYKDKVFHVQTEDSGPAVPIVTTHVFLGGNIVASRKTRYGDLIKRGEGEDSVRKLMQNQHKQLMRELLAGQYDEEIKSLEPHLPAGPARSDRLEPERAEPARSEANKEPSKAEPSESSEATDRNHKTGNGMTLPVSSSAPRAAAGKGATDDPHSSPTRPGTALDYERASYSSAGHNPSRPFGWRIISDRRLDEVVLEYLASRSKRDQGDGNR